MSLTLILLSENTQTQTWIANWARLYPETRWLNYAPNTDRKTWIEALNQTIQECEGTIFIVALGVGVWATAAWHYQADLLAQKRLQGVILVSPDESVLSAWHLESLRACRFFCKTALVLGQNDDWISESAAMNWAKCWQARVFYTPYHGAMRVNNEWQWGMQLMQEMLD